MAVYNPYFNNPYLQQYMPPYQAVPQQVQQPVAQQPVLNTPQSMNNIIWVSGEAEARSYPITAGNSLMLMDAENPVVYKKSADLSGKPLPLEIYDIVKREHVMESKEENHQINIEEYLTRKEFDTYTTEMDKRLSDIIAIDEDYEDDVIEAKPVRRTRRIRKDDER